MNRTAIVKFLAEQMGWGEIKGEDDHVYPYQDRHGGIWTNPNGIYWQPLIKIEHAWMIAEHINLFADHILRRWIGRWQIGNYTWDINGTEFHIFAKGNTAPEVICIAATRVFATDEQIQEFGL